MTQEFIDRLFAALLGYCEHAMHDCTGFTCPTGGKCNQESWEDWSPSSSGEATKEVRDWFAKELPEEWEKYLVWIWTEKYHMFPFNRRSHILNAQLSITNLAQFIVDNYKELPEEIQKRLKDGGIVE